MCVGILMLKWGSMMKLAEGSEGVARYGYAARLSSIVLGKGIL